MLSMLIIADDLSGAADCAVVGAVAGLNTIVALGETANEVHSDVLSVDADTRRMQAGPAAEEVGRLVRKYARDEKVLLFKKIDSTLRGNVGVELAATLAAHRSLHARLDRTVAVMAPAFPAMRRTTLNGFQLLDGQPLSGTEIWRLQSISGRCYIPEMLQSAGLKSTIIPLHVIRSGDRIIVDAMRASANQTEVLVCDAETDADLKAISDASMSLGRKTMWVGSTGLAYHLLKAAKPVVTTAVTEREAPSISGSLLFVIGSLSRNSREQVRVLTTSETLRLSIPADILLAGPDSSRWHKYEALLSQAVEMNRDIMIEPGPELQVGSEDGSKLSAALAQMTSSISGKIGALIAAGGETARTVLQRWGVTELRVLWELEIGVPFSITENWSRQLPVITKAGDFGTPETLLNCRNLLHGKNRGMNLPQDKRRVYQ